MNICCAAYPITCSLQAQSQVPIMTLVGSVWNIVYLNLNLRRTILQYFPQSFIWGNLGDVQCKEGNGRVREDGFSTISCICAKTENLTARNKIHTTGIHRHPDSDFHLFTHSHNVKATQEHHSCTDLILSCQLSCPVMTSCPSSCLLRASCLFPS